MSSLIHNVEAEENGLLETIIENFMDDSNSSDEYDHEEELIFTTRQPNSCLFRKRTRRSP